DTDGDGIIDPIEMLASNQGDGDGDGTADWQQANVASLPEAKNGNFVTIVSSEHPLENVRPVSMIEETFTSKRLPFGLFAFDVTGVEQGSIATVELVLPEGTHVSRYYKSDSSSELTPFDYNG